MIPSFRMGVIASAIHRVVNTGGAFDAYTTGMELAYGLELLITAYTGPCLRVRRDSDNTELDIGFGSDNKVDSTAMLTFVGSGNGYVSKWYDQTGLGQHGVNSTAAYQAIIVSAGTYLGEIQFDGVDDYLTYNSPAATVLTTASLMRLRSDTGTGTYGGIFGLDGITPSSTETNYGSIFIVGHGTNVLSMGSSGYFNATGTQDTTQRAEVIVLQASPTRIQNRYLDGVNSVTGGNGSGSLGDHFPATTGSIGQAVGSVGAGFFSKLSYKTFVIWSTNRDSDVAGITTALL